MKLAPYNINCLGLKCPLPVLRLEKALAEGQNHIIIISDDPVSVIDIPVAVQKAHAKLIAQNMSEGAYKFEILREST